MHSSLSRYTHSMLIRRTADEALYVSTPPRMEYIGGYDEVLHVVKLGDTLFNLAAFYYAAFPMPAMLWWVIADFQPEPINDPTVALEPNTVLCIPSPDFVSAWLERVEIEEDMPL